MYRYVSIATPSFVDKIPDFDDNNHTFVVEIVVRIWVWKNRPPGLYFSHPAMSAITEIENNSRSTVDARLNKLLGELGELVVICSISPNEIIIKNG